MTIKFRIVVILLLALSTVFSPAAAGGPPDKRMIGDREQRVERTIATTENVSVALCVTSGDITVHGWDRKEIRARARSASQIELRRESPAASSPASRVTVLLSGSGASFRTSGVECQVFGDVELDVPRGATVQLRSGDGIVRVTGVAGVFIETQSGDIEVSEASRVVEAGSLNGFIKITNSVGRTRVHSIGGDIEAINLRPGEVDDFSVSTVSGDVRIDRVGHQQVSVRTATGSVVLTGPLVKGGRYSFGTISGDVTLKLPANSSFQLNAKVSPQGDIVTDFPLKTTGEATPPAPTPSPAMIATVPSRKPRIKVVDAGTRKVNGTYGDGDSIISLASFSGTLALRKE